ncbi:unnamed protein product, partial [Microthlaspi erraticum]
RKPIRPYQWCIISYLKYYIEPYPVTAMECRHHQIF